MRELEAKLGEYTEDVYVDDTEDMVRPGGLVRLDEKDDTPRFLGPSSGIAMTRLVMEEAKKYTDTRTIREIVPEVRLRVRPGGFRAETKEIVSHDQCGSRLGLACSKCDGEARRGVQSEGYAIPCDFMLVAIPLTTTTT